MMNDQQDNAPGIIVQLRDNPLPNGLFTQVDIMWYVQNDKVLGLLSNGNFAQLEREYPHLTEAELRQFFVMAKDKEEHDYLFTRLGGIQRGTTLFNEIVDDAVKSHRMDALCYLWSKDIITNDEIYEALFNAEDNIYFMRGLLKSVPNEAVKSKPDDVLAHLDRIFVALWMDNPKVTTDSIRLYLLKAIKEVSKPDENGRIHFPMIQQIIHESFAAKEKFLLSMREDYAGIESGIPEESWLGLLNVANKKVDFAIACNPSAPLWVLESLIQRHTRAGDVHYGIALNTKHVELVDHILAATKSPAIHGAAGENQAYQDELAKREQAGA